MKLKAVVSLFFVCLLLVPDISGANVLSREHIAHYEVKPVENGSLLHSLRASSPIERNGRTYYGKTEWTVIPDFRYHESYGLCRIKDVLVRLQVRFILPRISVDYELPGPDRARFDHFYKALHEHEKGHQELGQQAAQEIYELLKKMGPYGYCFELEKAAKTKIGDIIKKYEKLNQEYDKQTDFGRTQGAVIK